jgi:hypothetical protein
MRWASKVMRRHMYAYALSGLLLLGGALLAVAQNSQPDEAQTEQAKQTQERSEQFQAKVHQATRALESDPRLQKLTQQQRKDLVEFVTGNMLFALLHELGHAQIAEMGLLVLGREEDAADSYAVTAMLNVGTNISDRVLIQATRGWFLVAERRRKEGRPLPFYDQHGMDSQRAYQIVCLMVGSDPEKFAAVATQVRMPKERQDSCSNDYLTAAMSWEKALRPHLRLPTQPRQKIEVSYGPVGDYAVYAQALGTIGVVELVADYAANRFTWRRPITFDVKSCGEVTFHWDISIPEVLICYEMAADFAHLYRDYVLFKGDRGKGSDDRGVHRQVR